ncbi:MAG: hypothetical protein JXR73_03205 [Candidatus Omnitrophica bacterium]|nr:hypothetical protein [Candidatus Omnitrophota bacterium]
MGKTGINVFILSVLSIFTLPAMAQTTVVPLYETGNVLAVGVYNDSNTSSDLAVSAELSDNNGVVYVSGAMGDFPESTTLKWKTVLFDDGSGAEEPGWQERDFDDSGWMVDDTGLGFPIGHGTSSEEGKIDIPVDPSEETIYTRCIFDAQNFDSITELTIKIAADDGAVAWFNGIYVGFSGIGTSDRGELPEDWVYDTGVSSGSYGAWDEGDPFAFTGTGTAQFTVEVSKSSSASYWELMK